MGENKRCLMVTILIQAINAGMFLLSKAAFNAGMNHYVYIFYRQVAATVFLSPFAFFRWKDAPPLTFFTFCKIFWLSLLGIAICLNLYGIALVYTSATLAAATANCLPVITFFVALLLRMEVLRLKSIAGAAKLAGILFCIGGVGIVAFYKGPQLNFFNNHHHLLSIHKPNNSSSLPLTNNSWLMGCFLMLSSNTLWSVWVVLQAMVLKSYSSKLQLTNLQCLLSSFQSFGIAIAMERQPHKWKLGWNLQLLAVIYCGMMTAVTFCLQAWVIEKKGPVYLAMSTPLALIITAFFSAIFLGESITLGSTLGGMLLVGGLYFVLWGKCKEQTISEALKEDTKEGNMEEGKYITKSDNENSHKMFEFTSRI
ncbi:WAT1-related protein At5g64700 [Cucumis sativus]|nr:WAT1-related protein At5g64700 [Cucumis sativus]